MPDALLGGTLWLSEPESPGPEVVADSAGAAHAPASSAIASRPRIGRGTDDLLSGQLYNRLQLRTYRAAWIDETSNAPAEAGAFASVPKAD
jgi:hypothetical protein